MEKILIQRYKVVFQIALAAMCLLIVSTSVVPGQAIAQQVSTPPEPLVAIHVSERTQALETTLAAPPTPTGPGTSGNEWWYTSWHYFVAYESLKEALRSDGTPFIEVSDSDIAAGKLLQADGSPRYPILISLASEAVADNEIAPLRDYVSAGGFLFVGSSAFTRNPDGTTRGDFALAGEMGLHMANSNLLNWHENNHFTKTVAHRLTNHIPNGTLVWNAPLTSEEVPWGVSPTRVLHGSHYVWQVVASGATVIANGDSGPLLAVKNYGHGLFIYHGAIQPLIGHGGYDPGMYAYLIYRRAIEWAFESFSLPIVKVSPWPFQYDAAFIVRHDFENYQSVIRSIEASAQFEHSLGIKGDYVFCTGALREDMGGDAVTIASLRSAVSNYGATIGSHNGGLRNPVNNSLLQTDYDYWHWGPDEALDTVQSGYPLASSPPGYSSGKAYAYESAKLSFQDIEGWLAGVDNGRAGCGAANNCPRFWVAPYFNSTRDDSLDIVDQLGAVIMGEQKISPFPHKTPSYKTPGKYYAPLTLPVSDWYVGTSIAQSTEYGHTLSSIDAAVDFYYNLGLFINFYGHAPSNDRSVEQEYVTHAASKPGIWKANSIGINDWWRLRSNVLVAPTINRTGNTYIVTTSVSGATDSATAVEIALPQISGQTISNMSVFLDDTLATSSDYRTTNYGIKVRVGSSVSTVRVEYVLQGTNLPPVAVNDTYGTNANTALNQAAPGVLGNDTDPEGAALTTQLVSGPSHGTLTLNADGSFAYTPASDYAGSDSFTYVANDGTTDSNTATVTITVTSAGGVLFSDDFTRGPNPPDPLSPWISALGTWTITNGVLQGSSSLSTYASIHTETTPLWTDYSVEGQVQFPAGAFGGGIGGRVNPATGARYSAWIYPDGSLGGSNVLKLVKFRDWTTWNGVPMKQVSLPSVGTGWHALKMVFKGSRIQVSYDGTLMIDVTDNNYDSRAPYLSGGISGDLWTYTSSYVMGLDNVVVSTSAINSPPAAMNDTYSTTQNTTLNQAAPGVLGNDTDPEGAALTTQLVSGPSHGALTLNANGSFAYTPAADYAGSDSFTYRANDGTTNSNAATVTITVIAAVNLPPVAMNDTYSTTQNTTLNQAAPGVLGNDTDPERAALTTQLVSGPSHGALTLNANGSFAYTPAANYAGSDSFTYTANDGTNSSNVATVTITVLPTLTLSALSLNPTSVTGGSTSQGTVTLSGPAPSGGVAVSLSNNSSAASVPASVTVPSGSTSATFTITTNPVASSTSVTISADYGGVTRTATLTIAPPALSSLSRSPSSVVGGKTSQGTVTLSGPAPSNGVVVSLSDNSSAASVPASVTVPSGSTSATFTITTIPVASSTSVTISASYGGVTRTATLTVTPPVLSALSLNPTSVRGGSTSQGTVRLSGPAPSNGVVVSLRDNSSAAGVPVNVTVLAGNTSATFTITTTPVASSTSVTISASYGGVTRRATLRVTP